MKIFLRYSWLNKSLALPLGCDVGPFFFVWETLSLSSNLQRWPSISWVDCNWQKWLSRGYFFLSLYVLPNCKFFNFLYSLWGFSSFLFFFSLCSFHILPFTLFRKINYGLECTASCKLSSFHSTLSREKKIKDTPSPQRLGSIYIHDMDDRYGILTIHIHYFFIIILKKGEKSLRPKTVLIKRAPSLFLTSTFVLCLSQFWWQQKKQNGLLSFDRGRLSIWNACQ